MWIDNQRQKEWNNLAEDLFIQMDEIAHNLENHGYVCKPLKDQASVTLTIAYNNKNYRSYSYQITYAPRDTSFEKINIFPLKNHNNIVDNKVYHCSISLEDMRAEMEASVPTQRLKDFVDFVVSDRES